MLGRITLTAAAAVLAAASATSAAPSGDWGTAQKIDTISGHHADINTPFLDGCPIQSPDGKQLFIASNRPHPDYAGLNIWVASRDSTDEPFGAPEILPAPVNSASDDFCPTPLRGDRLMFVSRRTIDGVTCGMGDIYVTRLDKKHGWREPRHLRCAPDGPNSSLDEQGPSYVDTGDGSAQLYFSRSSGSVPGDLFVSSKPDGGGFGPASAITELNSAGNDIQPNVRKDGREIVFSTNHTHPGHVGGQDIYVATRESAGDPWSAPVNLGAAVNTTAGETRPSLSWDASTLLFGRAPGPEGQADIYVSGR